ncbi:MAG TPA: tyrosine-type recombinase/integrase [Bacillota bacterium]|nr:tyrosine-type recombinase/integrase [Bacillota bacterium]
MASVVSKPNGTYLIRISCGIDGEGKQIAYSRTFKPSNPNLPYQKLNREIEVFTAEFEQDVKERGANARPENMSFAVFCDKYLNVKKGSLSPNTYPFYEKVIRTMLIPMFGNLKLKEIKTYHVQQFIQYLSLEKPRGDDKVGHIAPPTVKRYTTVLRSILTMAYKLEYMDEDVGLSRRIEFPKETTPEVEVYTQEEVADILRALETEPLNIRLLVETALFTGMRRAEIVGLKWSDIDFEKKKLSVKRSIYKPKAEKAIEKAPKSKCSTRIITIPDRLCLTLLEYKTQQDKHISFLGKDWHNLDYVFTEEDGYVMNPQTPTKQFSKFLARHSIRHLKFHGLRHTSATMLLANGCDIKTVSSRLGHADLDITNVYVHALEATDRVAAETFDRILRVEGK